MDSVDNETRATGRPVSPPGRRADVPTVRRAATPLVRRTATGDRSGAPGRKETGGTSNSSTADRSKKQRKRQSTGMFSVSVFAASGLHIWNIKLTYSSRIGCSSADCD